MNEKNNETKQAARKRPFKRRTVRLPEGTSYGGSISRYY
jgi:hypothetical protein